MNKFKINIYRTAHITEVTPPNNLQEGSISSTFQATNQDVCSLFVDTPCYIETVTTGLVVNGDKVFSDAQGIVPIAGQGRYYKLILIDIYNVSIDDNGVITVDSICL